MASEYQGIRLRPHDGIDGEVLLLELDSTATRSSTDSLAGLRSAGIEVAGLSTTRGFLEGKIMVIEKLFVKDPLRLRRDPVQIELPEKLEENEVLFPVMFDGEHYRVIGESVVEENGQTVVNLREMPASGGDPGVDPFRTGEENTRSLGNALKLAFFKIALKQNDLNKLRWVKFLPDGQIERISEGLEEKCSGASNILLLIHGIIGNTEDIATGLAKAQSPEGKPLSEAYDLVLTYDYENLNTPIEETGKLFKEALEEAGFGKEDGKQLTILAHSMGGLVSRWMIEREGGKEFVDRLILAGTPNSGSNFGKIEGFRSFAVVALDLALNVLPNLIPYAGTALKVLKAPTQVLVTLGQMNPGSDFLTKLNSSKDPGVSYLIVGGDATQYESTAEKKLARLMEKMELAIGDLVNRNQPHDIAVQLSSIFNEGVWGDRNPMPRHLAPVCHHLNYFHEPRGMEALVQIGLGNAEKGGTPVSTERSVNDHLTSSFSAIGETVEEVQEAVTSAWDRFVAWLRKQFGV